MDIRWKLGQGVGEGVLCGFFGMPFSGLVISTPIMCIIGYLKFFHCFLSLIFPIILFFIGSSLWVLFMEILKIPLYAIFSKFR